VSEPSAPAAASRRPLALFLPKLLGGGAERVTLNLARGLVAEGWPVDLVLASVSGPYASAVPEGVRVVDLGDRRTLASVPALAGYLRRERPSGLLAAMNHANVAAVWAAALARYRGPLLLAEHNELPPPSRGAWQRAFNVALRVSYPRADRVIAVSHGVKRSLAANAGVAAERIEVIYNPVIDAGLLEEDRPRPPALAADGPPVVVGVGRLTRQKNFPNLVRAFGHLRRQREVRLMILGEGEERPALEALVAELGLEDDVAMPGFVDDAYDYLAHADLFALSSDWEGLPTVVIEALALGARVVATDCPSGPREILADGRYGELVPTGDAQALAEAMGRALDAPRPHVPDAWLHEFSVRTATRHYLEAFGLAAR
jgi:glycosyltransferase involved in cell wall biosynthesis